MKELAILLVLATATACAQADRRPFAEHVKAAAAKTPPWVDRGAFGTRIWEIEQEFYEARDWLPAWIDGDDPTPQLDRLLEVLKQAEAHGLDPAVYGYSDLAAARQKADAAWFGATFEHDQIPDLELRLTYAYLAHAADLLGWRTSPRQVARDWLPAPREADLVARLQAAVEGNEVRESLESLAPAHPQYRGLQAALSRARTEGSHEQAAKIRINLERWRWAPRDLGERHILVNVPSYQMQVVEGEAPVLAMRVIVGAKETPTPIFSDQMTYVVFSPYWNIPETILREETLPRLSEDPDYLARNNIEVVGTSGEVVEPEAIDWEDESLTSRLRFRQAPGPENALGLVKFIFPNHFSVYLHDTPTDALFNRKTRTLSHGCIRVEQPVELAEYVLRDKQQWTPDRIRAAMAAQEEQTVTLREPLPVHIGYWTAWVDADGSVRFVDDPYGLDEKQLKISGF